MSSPAEVLAHLRSSLVARLADADAELVAIRSARSDATADDEHDPEGSTLSADWSRVQGLREATVLAIAEADVALERVADGSYGVCIRCGRPIAPGRLEARPTAALCIDCASLAA